MAKIKINQMSWSLWLSVITSVVITVISVTYMLMESAIPYTVYVCMIVSLLTAYVARFAHCYSGSTDCPMGTDGLKNSTQLCLLLLLLVAFARKN